MAGFPGFGTHATDLAALDQYVEQAAVKQLFAFNEPFAVSAGNAPAASAVQSLVHSH